MTRHYSCAHQTRRWPMRIFIELLDIACINAFIIWRAKYPAWKESCRSRRAVYIEELSIELVQPNIQFPATRTCGLHKSTLDAMHMMDYGPDAIRRPTGALQQPRRCEKYPRAAVRKTNDLFCLWNTDV